jgi:hypothetical protein
MLAKISAQMAIYINKNNNVGLSSEFGYIPGGLSLGVKWPGCEADHSPPSSAKVKECMELYFHSPSLPSWRCS